jgi:phage terminase large subunit GpA-like protein
MSKRAEDRDGKRMAAVNPGGYIEDWDLLVDEVIRKTYPIQGTDKRMRVRVTLGDSGGSEGVTANAYAFWRKLAQLRLAHASIHAARFGLVKGDGRLDIPRTQQSFPDYRSKSNKQAIARGDVPVYILNSNALKDSIAADLGRNEPGPGFVHFADWLPHSFYSELTAEVRKRRGWENPGNARNESLDLHAYNTAAYILLGAERFDWSRPPNWVAEQIITPSDKPAEPVARVKTIADLARSLNG